MHNSLKINGTYNMILSICLVKIQYHWCLGVNSQYLPSLDLVPTGQNCAGKWLLWPPTVKLSSPAFSFPLPDIVPLIVNDLSFFPVLISSLFSVLPPCSWFLSRSLKCIRSSSLSIVKNYVHFLWNSFCYPFLLLHIVCVLLEMAFFFFIYIFVIPHWPLLKSGTKVSLQWPALVLMLPALINVSW